MVCRNRMMFFFLFLVILLGGCRRVYTFVPVEGTVTQNGQPLVGVQIVFFPDLDAGIEGPRSSAITDETGHYRLRTDEGNEGSVVGRHRVCVIELPAQDHLSRLRRSAKVVSTEVAEKMAQKHGLKVEAEPTKPKIPAIYGQIQDTPLRAEVRSGGTQTFDFEIPSTP